MADQPNHIPDFEIRMRAYIAIGLLCSIVVMIAYTLWEYGHILAVLTLILGWLTGTANVLLSPYFGSPNTSKKTDGNQPITGDKPSIVVNNPTQAPDKEV